VRGACNLPAHPLFIRHSLAGASHVVDGGSKVRIGGSRTLLRFAIEEVTQAIA